MGSPGGGGGSLASEGGPPVAGATLGPLLGRGSFGSVHFGQWNGQEVAIKVRRRSGLSTGWCGVDVYGGSKANK